MISSLSQKNSLCKLKASMLLISLQEQYASSTIKGLLIVHGQWGPDVHAVSISAKTTDFKTSGNKKAFINI